MKIIKILNNNAIICTDSNNIEKIALGKGLGFGCRIGDTVQENKIEKVFTPDTDEVKSRFQQIVAEIPIAYILLTEKIICAAKSRLPILHDTIYVTLSDHIGIAIERYKQNKTIDVDLDLLKLFVNKNKNWYKKDKNSYLSQFYKDDSNTRNLPYSIKNYITKLPEYCSLQDFENNNNIISITTDNDSVLKQYVKEKYNIELKKGIDIIAKSKNNNIYIIECKLILNIGGSQK